MEKSIRKNKIILNIFLVAMFFALFLLCVGVCLPKTIVVAEERQQKAGNNSQEQAKDPFAILSYLDISQEGYVFTKQDFLTDYETQNSSYEDKTNFAIFTNQSVTLNILKPTEPGHYFHSVTIYINNQDAKTSDYYYPSSDALLDSSFYLDISNSDTDKESYIYISLEIFYPDKQDSSKNFMKTVDFKFFLVQTPVNFEKENSSASNNFINWDYTFENQHLATTAPENLQTYSTLNLTFPAGTKLNPVYVDFIYCGEHYKIYRYKDQSGTVKTFNAFNDSELAIDKMAFNNSGTYTVKIYDKTVNSNCPTKNFYEYKFIIKNTTLPTKGFFINAYTQNGQQPIMSGQYTNQNVVVEFTDFKNIKNKISQISIIRAYQPSISENIPVETTYTPDTLPSSMIFNEDGSYSIELKQYNGNILSEYHFIVTKSIKTSFKIGDKIYKASESDKANTTTKYEIDNSLTTNFNGIVGETNFSFDIVVARSVPRIYGVEDGARVQGSVNLYVYGVGTINVYVSLDGTQMMLDTEYKNGDRLPTFTEQGKYFVRITDQMGSTITRTFNVTVKLNTASMILIIIAVSVVVMFIVFFIISRRKVKVR